MPDILPILMQMRWQDAMDIALVSFVVYQGILLLRGTRGMNMLVGLGLVLVFLVVSQQLELPAVHWIIQSFLSSLVLVVIILFQSDIRKALAQIGRPPFLGTPPTEMADAIEDVVRSAVTLASRMTGALIVLERRIGLAEYVQAGVGLDSKISRGLLIQLFQTSGPLHDGAVIIRGDRILAARCMLPLATNPKLVGALGSRHRAALGLSEESDAVCVVVSEERGRVSVAEGGKLTQDLDAAKLRKLLTDLFPAGERQKRKWIPWGKTGAA